MDKWKASYNQDYADKAISQRSTLLGKWMYQNKLSLVFVYVLYSKGLTIFALMDKWKASLNHDYSDKAMSKSSTLLGK